MSFETYIGYVSEKDEEAESGTPVVLEVRDLDTYERKIVRAVIAKPGADLADSDELWILDWVEAREEAPWRIRVLEELEEDDEAAANLRSDISEADLTAEAERSQLYGSGRGRGGSMPEMMGGEEARKFFENMQARKMGQKK